MRCFIGTRDHAFADDPVWMASEVGAARNVTRMIGRVPDGRAEHREAALEGWPGLSDQPFEGTDGGTPDDPAMTLVEVPAATFEEHWREDLKAPGRFP